jgi:hypothetical protein
MGKSSCKDAIPVLKNGFRSFSDDAMKVISESISSLSIPSVVKLWEISKCMRLPNKIIEGFNQYFSSMSEKLLVELIAYGAMDIIKKVHVFASPELRRCVSESPDFVKGVLDDKHGKALIQFHTLWDVPYPKPDSNHCAAHIDLLLTENIDVHLEDTTGRCVFDIVESMSITCADAERRGFKKLAMFMYRNGADDANSGDDLLKAAFEAGDMGMVNHLLTIGLVPSPESTSTASLHKAIEGNHLDLVKYFVKTIGVSIKAKDPDSGLSAIAVATKANNEVMIAFLQEIALNAPKIVCPARSLKPKDVTLPASTQTPFQGSSTPLSASGAQSDSVVPPSHSSVPSHVLEPQTHEGMIFAIKIIDYRSC